MVTDTPNPDLAPTLDAREVAAIQRLLVRTDLTPNERRCAEQGAAFHGVEVPARHPAASHTLNCWAGLRTGCDC